MRYHLFLFGLLVLLAACVGEEPIDQTLDQTLWSLDSIRDVSIDVEPIASIGFGEGEVGGTTGCNTFGGAYRVVPDSDTISIGPLRSTLAACASDALAARERAMMASLQSAATYLITSEGLELRDAVGEILSVYRTVVPDLADTSWKVIGYNTGTQSVRSVISGTELNLEFDQNGQMVGSSGCNTFNGEYEVGGDYTVVGGQMLSVGPLASTEMSCVQPDGIMEQESQFLAALGNSDLWRLVGSNLELRDTEGALQVSAFPGD